MIQELQLSSHRHHDLHSGYAETVRLELITWLEEELRILNLVLQTSTELESIMRVQGAVQTLEKILVPLKERPTYQASQLRSGAAPVL